MSCFNKHSWLGVHIYYNEPWELFLAEALEPFVHTILGAGIIQQYFFERFWEKGPHIRLYLKGESEVLNSIIKPNIEEHFYHYFQSKPSKRIEPNYPALFPDKLKWHSNNSIIYEEYTPRIEKYGGIEGYLLVEEQFQISSKVVLGVFKKYKDNWSPQYGLDTALKLHLSLAYINKLSLMEMESFFRMNFYTWMPKAYAIYEKRLTKNEQLQEFEKLVNAYETSFGHQKERWTIFVSDLLIKLENENYEDSINQYWFSSSKALKLRADKFIESNLSYPEHTNAATITTVKDNNTKLEYWTILSHFIHKTNNRLGIHNKNEGFLCYILMRSLECL